MIRAAGPDDLAALVDLDAELFGVDSWSPASFAGSLVATTVSAGPDPHSDLDGYAVLTVAGEVADLQRIGVRRGCRRAGLATALLETVTQAGREGMH